MFHMHMTMNNTGVIAILTLMAFMLTWIIFPLTLHMARKYNIVDMPDARKLQKTPIPVLGGVAVAIGMFIPLICAASYFSFENLWYVVGAMFVLVVIGVTDDIKNLPAWLRFTIEIILMWLLVWCTNTMIDDLHGLWGLCHISVMVSLPLSIVAGVGIINSINLIDGVDGYSSGYGIIANILFAIFFFHLHEDLLALFSLVSVAALIPFFCHNVFGKTSKMFLGDGGSLLIGMVMAYDVFCILSKFTRGDLFEGRGFGFVAFAVSVLCVPVFDTLRVMFTRICHGISPFTPDKTHFHHLFIDYGFSHAATTTLILTINLVVVGIWWVVYHLGASINLQFYSVLISSIFATFGVYHSLRYCERKKNRVYFFIKRIGQWSHFEQKGIYLFLQKVVDSNLVLHRIGKDSHCNHQEEPNNK